MKALFGILVSSLALGCGAEPVEESFAEPVAVVEEAALQPRSVERYILGFIDKTNVLSYGADVVVRYAGQWVSFSVIVTDYETGCWRANGYSEEVAAIEASLEPRKMGRQQAALVMNDLELWVEPVCP